MARCQPLTTLRSRIIRHPPVAVFFMCLLLMAGAFISIGIYSQNHDIKNPDVSMDWNQMLGSLAELKFCTQLNNTDLLNEKQDMNSPSLLDHADQVANNTKIVSMFLLVPLMHAGDDLDHNSISSTILGSQLGLKGSSGKQSLNISLFLDIMTRISATDPTPIQKPSEMQTKHQSFYSCLKITAPLHILPQTLPPPQCPLDINLRTPVRTHAVQSNKKSSNLLSCLRVEFTPDPKLTVLLTQKEKALARYHLLLVSIVLLAICITACLSGTFTCSKSPRHITNDPQKEALMGR